MKEIHNSFWNIKTQENLQDQLNEFISLSGIERVEMSINIVVTIPESNHHPIIISGTTKDNIITIENNFQYNKRSSPEPIEVSKDRLSTESSLVLLEGANLTIDQYNTIITLLANTVAPRNYVLNQRVEQQKTMIPDLEVSGKKISRGLVFKCENIMSKVVPDKLHAVRAFL